MTTNQAAESNRSLFSSAFFNSLVAAISEASGSPWLVAAVPGAPSTSEETELVRINLTLEGNLRGEMLLEFNQEEVAILAANILGSPTADYGTEAAEAVLKFVNAGAEAFSNAVVETYGIFTIAAVAVEEPPSNLKNVAEGSAADEAGNRISFRMYLNPALTEGLAIHAQTVDEAQAPPEPETDEPTTNAKTTDPATDGQVQEWKAIADELNLTLVMDVELNVTLRFGQRQLTLREVMELTSGSVIELDRQVDEPVELLLDGKVIAKGEAVVIDGNYGLRVTEVPQPITPAVLR
jgi:flagellar motor switch protein FliN